ncbi:unnamed protein product [Merluccius merluccius]
MTSDETVAVGGTVTLTCRVAESDDSSLQWSNTAQQTLYFGEKRGEMGGAMGWEGPLFTGLASCNAITCYRLPTIHYTAITRHHRWSLYTSSNSSPSCDQVCGVSRWLRHRRIHLRKPLLNPPLKPRALPQQLPGPPPQPVEDMALL